MSDPIKVSTDRNVPSGAVVLARMSDVCVYVDPMRTEQVQRALGANLAPRRLALLLQRRLAGLFRGQHAQTNLL